MANKDKIQIYKNQRTQRDNIDRAIAQSFYSPDSSARQVELVQSEPAHYPDPEPTAYPEPNRRDVSMPPAPRQKQNKRRKAKQAQEFAVDIQARHRHNFLAYMLVLAFFGSLALILALNARFEHDHMALEADRAQLVALHSGNAARASEIYADLDLAHIEAFAIEHLGMIQPEDFQMVEVVVTPQSFFSAAPIDTPSTDSFSFNRFWNVLFSLDADAQE